MSERGGERERDGDDLKVWEGEKGIDGYEGKDRRKHQRTAHKYGV